MQDSKYSELCDIVSMGRVQYLSSVFQEDSSIDILYSDGKLLRAAIQGGNDTETTGLLINYFNNVQLAKSTAGSREHAILNHRFKCMLQYAAEDEPLSEEMALLLLPYIRPDDNQSDNTSITHSDNSSHSAAGNTKLSQFSFLSANSTKARLTLEALAQIPEITVNDLLKCEEWRLIVSQSEPETYKPSL